MEWVTTIWDSYITFLDFLVFYVVNFFEFFDDGVRLIMRQLAKATMWISYQAILAAGELVDELLANFDISSHMQSGWNAIPDRERQLLAFFRLPEIVNMLFSAVSTKFALQFMPFGGR